MSYYASSLRPHQQTKRTPLGGDETATCFAIRRISGRLIPTHRTPPPTEAIVQPNTAYPALNDPGFADWLHDWHKQNNGE